MRGGATLNSLLSDARVTAEVASERLWTEDKRRRTKDELETGGRCWVSQADRL
jgi:hypothetical protein